MKTTKTGFTLARYIGFYSSLVIILFSLLTIQFKGFNFAVDFTGGVITEIQTDQPVSETQLQTALSEVIDTPFSLINVGSDLQWSIRQGIDSEKMPETSLLMGNLDADFSVEVLSASVIGPQVGDELFEAGALAIIASLIAMLLYLSLRFEWRLASGSVAALFHDIIIVLGIFSLLQIEFDLTVLAALLAVIGYSLNDSIVISDRIREMLRTKMKGSLNEIINSAILSTLTRTLITSGTTLGTVSAIWLLAGQPLEGFSIALFTGILVGTFSSVCISATVPELLSLKREHYQRPEEVKEVENYR
ncbi:protein-export membrane protein SecF [Psychromonas marina]|uniref:Protein-export membrane protein SecF n=1 Tax=Psychromonas marina TaxID=88364 RepID=A0ABQ6DWY4_9GAMM|nr:protein translocase subunit SecF [Psychromonas marina]GLS89236.1 protein-export membrane protein SecF [Psychromonas marina]